jgi:transcriptional regulator with XRE-family HTH domain
MKGAGLELSIGERVAYYRRRRGLTQFALGGLVGRTASWVEKAEHGRIPLDRISVVRHLAVALDVSLHDLLPDDIAAVDPSTRGRSVPALRDLLLSYRAVNPRFSLHGKDVRVPEITEVRTLVNDVWTAYQDSRFGYVVMRLNETLPIAAAAAAESADHAAASGLLAYLYQVAASVLVKLGDLDLARLCADRGDIAAQEAGDPVTVASLQRSIAHTLLSNGQYADSVTIVREGIIDASDLRTPEGLSVTGTLMLVGAIAAARAGESVEATAFLRHADRLAAQLGTDSNHVWTAFGPTNVAIHRVSVAAELGEVGRAIELASGLDVTALPRERQIRHHLELARAQARVAHGDEALTTLLNAEQAAPDQVRRHFLTHELVHGWLRTSRTRPSPELVALARRLGHAA